MEFGEIFSNALKYPISDYEKLLILGLVFLIIGLPGILSQLGFANDVISGLWIIVTIVGYLFILGYGLSVIRESIGLNDEIPDVDWVKNIVDGIKSFVVTFIYYLIPTIIVAIFGFISLASFGSLIPDSAMAAIETATTPDAFFNAIPPEAWGALAAGLSVTIIVAIILFILFGLFQSIALCRLAKYDSFGEAFAIGQIWNDIKQIGVLRLFGFLIVLAIIVFVIALIMGILGIIPVIGSIIVCLVGQSFISLFSNRAIGLLYSDVE